MKKFFLFVAMAAAANVSLAQYPVFMEMLENKKICNKEDQLTYFLQSNSFERGLENTYTHRYAVNGKFFTARVVNQNECYVFYQTNDAKDYNKIKNEITKTCHKEYAADKSEYYVCEERRMHDVQVIFNGFLSEEGIYEIMVYQNPDGHESPYKETDRIAPADEMPKPGKKVMKKKKAVVAKSAAAQASPDVKTTTPAPAPATAPAPKPAAAKPAAPAVNAPSAPVKAANTSVKPAVPAIKTGAPPVGVTKPKEATVKSVTPSVNKK
ncbi:MAG: hypothetical protein JNM41_00395 [Flavipsychrobacter sp.]|nr:hypothetical protein [Flavipsychrobacter sp.]